MCLFSLLCLESKFGCYKASVSGRGKFHSKNCSGVLNFGRSLLQALSTAVASPANQEQVVVLEPHRVRACSYIFCFLIAEETEMWSLGI